LGKTLEIYHLESFFNEHTEAKLLKIIKRNQKLKVYFNLCSYFRICARLTTITIRIAHEMAHIHPNQLMKRDYQPNHVHKDNIYLMVSLIK